MKVKYLVNQLKFFECFFRFIKKLILKNENKLMEPCNCYTDEKNKS